MEIKLVTQFITFVVSKDGGGQLQVRAEFSALQTPNIAPEVFLQSMGEVDRAVAQLQHLLSDQPDLEVPAGWTW